MNEAPPRRLVFTKPEKTWQWLMLFTPGVIIIAGATIAGASVNPHGELRGLQVMVSGLLTGPIGALICLGLGWWLARENATTGRKILGAVLFGLALAAVNLAIGFPGCLLVSSR
jgi:hypothetical protein